MTETVYAKSNPKQTIKEHTDGLLKNFEILKKIYGEDIEKLLTQNLRNLFWETLQLVIKYHDTGKINILFQNKIRKKLNEPLLTETTSREIPHNFLSPAFFGDDLFNYNKEIIKVIVQSIVFHHERFIPEYQYVEENIKNDLEKRKHLISDVINLPETLWYGYERFYKTRITPKDNIYLFYILLKGLLHRLDHSTSAFIDVEIKDDSLNEKTLNFLSAKGGLRPIQKYTNLNKDKNLVIIASTGIGKTEAGLLWAGKNKTFFTLPLKVSVNAIFDRINDLENIGYSSTGLLHSSNLDHLDYEGYETPLKTQQNSKQLSYPLNISTIDQLFTFPFKYGGYEKILSTLLYSKVIIDEIQSYEPKLAAIILKSLQQINNLGGKFLIMTATLPQIYIDTLKQWNIDFEFQEFLSDTIRHKINLIDSDINFSAGDIKKLGEYKKVLVIVNTVKKAKLLFRNLKDLKAPIKMLHSMFISEDRRKLEKEISDFSKNSRNGIWITTQLAEASLDIDFDVLFTELSSLDSLFQRLGRVYRQREYNNIEPNIFIFTKYCSGIGTIYDKEIFNFSMQELIPFNLQFLNENKKVNMVKKIYSKEKLNGTKYYDEFKKSLNILDNILDYELSKKEAQNILRDIYSVKVIPFEIYNKHHDEIDKKTNIIIYSKDKLERLKAERFIYDKSLDVPYFRVKKSSVSLGEISNLKGISTINFKYDSDEGLLFDELIDNYI